MQRNLSHDADRVFGNYVLSHIDWILLDWIADNMNPEDVFPDEALDRWAEDNGYVVERGDDTK